MGYILDHSDQREWFESSVGTFVPPSAREAGVRNDLQQLRTLNELPLEQIVVPTLIVHGTADKLIPISGSEAMAARIPGATFHRVDGAGHLVELGPKGCRGAKQGPRVSSRTFCAGNSRAEDRRNDRFVTQRRPSGQAILTCGNLLLSDANMKWISPGVAQEFARAGTDAYRIADGKTCRIERFGDGAIVSYCNLSVPLEIVDELAAWCQGAGVSLRRTYARRLVTAPGRDDLPEALGSAAPPHSGIAHEEGLSYEIDFMAGYSCGLFLDQRANRRRVRTGCSGTLLNLFSYTCSFSVAAAAAERKP